MPNLNANRVDADEHVVRLLFTTRMVNESGTLGKEAFPVDELIERSGKSVSVDEMSKIQIPSHVSHKLETYQNPTKGRHRWGYSYAVCHQVESIKAQTGEQVYAVFKDPIKTNFPPAPWDHAHAKIVRAQSEFTKSFIRGYRDQLTELFQQEVVKVA